MKQVIFKVILSFLCVFTLFNVISDYVDAAVSSGGARGGSSSVSSSSASRSSSSSSMSSSRAMQQARASQSAQSKQAQMSRSQSSMSHKQAMQQSKNYQQSKQSTVPKGNKSSVSNGDLIRQSKQSKAESMTKPMTRPVVPTTKRTYSQEHTMASFYNNFLFYNLILNHNNPNHYPTEASQFSNLKKQLKPHEKVYTITVKTKKGKRVISLPKKDYDKVKEGSYIKYENGQLKAS